MKKLLAEWPQINWNLKLNQMHDTTRNRAQNKWSCHMIIYFVRGYGSYHAFGSCQTWTKCMIIVLCPIEFHGSPTWWKTGSPESFLGCPNYFGLSKKKQLFFSYEHKIAQECLTCSDAPLHYVEFKYTRYSEAFIENVKSPGSWTAKFGGRAGKRNQETKWIRVNTGTVKRTGDTAVLH